MTKKPRNGLIRPFFGIFGFFGLIGFHPLSCYNKEIPRNLETCNLEPVNQHKTMPIDPIKIPQNVYIEDRIVGPLTLKQIIVVAIGCGFSYAVYAMIAKSYGAVSIPLTVMIWLPGLVSFAFAFLKINDLSLLRICLLMVERINKPTTRTWAPRRGISINIRTFQGPPAGTQTKHETRLAAAGKKPQHIDELSSMLDLPTSATPDDVFNDASAEPIDEIDAISNAPAAQPVDPSRVSASPLHSSMDTVAAPSGGSVSVFRDLSPNHA